MKVKSGFISFIQKYKSWILIALLFSLHIFLRFSYMETKNLFGWDQVRDAWVSLDIIENSKYPLLGMVAKQNTGIYLGPAYYYLVAPFYFFSNLDPRASGILAGAVSIVNFWGLFFLVKKIFSFKVAFFATFINTIAMTSITFDRVQWSVEFFPLISLAIFYLLLKIISGNPRYIFLLAILLGLSFHLHFTAVFFLLIIALSLPLFPKNKETIKYILLAILLFAIWFLPNVIAELQSENIHTANLLSYIGTYYHGFHLTRFLQLAPDAFIQFEPFLFPVIKILKYLLIPIFFIIYMSRSINKSKIILFLIFLWFLVPWVVFTTYKGEISDYYFAINRYLAIAILAYLLNFIFEQRHVLIKTALVVLLFAYAYLNIANFLAYHTDGGLKEKRENVSRAIKEGRIINFTEGDPESYIYHIYKKKKQQ